MFFLCFSENLKCVFLEFIMIFSYIIYYINISLKTKQIDVKLKFVTIFDVYSISILFWGQIFSDFAKIEFFCKNTNILNSIIEMCLMCTYQKMLQNETTIHIDAQKEQKYVFMIHKMTSDGV